MMRGFTITPLSLAELAGWDLYEAAVGARTEGLAVEVYRAQIDQDAPLEVVWVPAMKRAGIGADPMQWTDAESVADAVCRYREGRMRP